MKIKFKTKEEHLKNIELIKETNFKKASYFLKISAFILIFDLFTYIIAIEMGFEDFGIFFELVSLLFATLSILACNRKKYKSSKSYILLSSAPIILLTLYDIIEIIINIEFYLYKLIHRYISFSDLGTLTLILILFFEFTAYNAIKKTDLNTIESPNNKDWFYDEI